MPIHDHLHWSLVLVAHPGWLPGTDPDREQCIIHFDSMEGGEQHWQVWLCTSSQYLRVVLPAIKHKGNELDDHMLFCVTRVCSVHISASGMLCCTGGHSTTVVTKAMRQYLQNEWERLVGGLLFLLPYLTLQCTLPVTCIAATAHAKCLAAPLNSDITDVQALQ